MKKILKSIKYITLKDVLSFFIFLFMIVPSLIYKLVLKCQNKKLWLICENKDTARDNGYHLFKYIRTNYKDEYVFYAIDKKSKDYDKIKKYGNVIQYESLKHWLYYMSAKVNISTQKAGNPAPALFYFVHVYLNLYNHRFFLQHGITKDNCKWLYYKDTKFERFICGAKREYDYINQVYGYPKENVIYTGFPRFDNLYDNEVNKRQILIMPTWRNWLGRHLNSLNKNIEFKQTEYFKHWNSILNNKDLIDFIEKRDITISFYPHISMQKYLKDFDTTSKNIEFVNNFEKDIQQMLKTSALLVTDYSSVYMDFAYMEKPIIYYQFDREEYRKNQWQEGYFSYDEDGFGPVFEKEKDVVAKIINYIESNYKLEEKYQSRIDTFFPLKDQNNCERVYQSIKEVQR